MQITERLLDEFRKDFETQMKGLESKYGVKVDLGNIRYSANQFTSKVTVTDTAGGDADEAKGKLSLKEDGWKFGLSPEDYNKRIEYLNKVFLIKGIRPRSRKYPIKVEDASDGKLYNIPGHAIK